jgi:hypothetical protein
MEKRLEMHQKVNIYDIELKKIASYSKIIEIDDDSENLASAVHICLTISF